ncbi:activator-dependent family glycosyltransferase [Thermomonospora cellulosilytica]|uniref:Glycosyltransferase (Activator-dependent family) n=1 Tax=Thermomonospora cellulosilytica TaxID=1411118 RepID=A0A7W3N576_9ACTN|nr:activator-dependent family glycosyltransferase [Thermomonospora cellulosilytica]MBA9007737.1 glycosyltransferase (activator-dependent family) [Thermomonospora cellulosilytica]
MRVLFVTNPFKAHLYAQVPLAWAFRAAGHEVCVAGPPEVAEAIAHCGLPGVSIGAEMPPLQERVAGFEAPEGPCDPRGDRTGKSVQSDYGWGDPHIELRDFTLGVHQVFFPDAMTDDLVGFARSWLPDLVIWDSSAFPGAVAAQVVGAAHARFILSVDRVAQVRSACRAAGFDSVGDPLRDWLQPILQRYGRDFDETTVLGQWTIAPTPRWIWQPDGVHYLPMRSVPFNGPATTPRWVYEPPARKRVCITQGISHRDAGIGGVASVGDLFKAVADLDIEVIATFNAQQLGSTSAIPDNVRVVDFVPFTSLLPTCSAIVHDGGVGSFATALENAVPQIIVPHDSKVEKWWGPVAMGDGLESRGAGVYAANGHSLTPDILRDSLKLVLEDPSFAANAARLRTEMRGMPTPSDVVPALEKLTADHRGSRP